MKFVAKAFFLFATIQLLHFPLGECWGGKIVFQDEFNGNALDTKKWDYEEGPKGYGSGNLETYWRNNVQVKNGKLVITAKVENRDGQNYTSGRIKQKGNGYAYGAFVMRAQLPDGKHLWPAFWLLKSSDCKYEELDIVEYRGQERRSNEMTAHYGRRYDAVVSEGDLKTVAFDMSTGFHEYALLWLKDKLEWYVDNQKLYEVSLVPASKWRQDKNKIPCGDVVEPFTVASNIYLNLGVGGSFFQNHGQLSVAEARQWRRPVFEVDWVRIYQG